MWPRRVKMPTQNLKLPLLLMLVMRIVFATVCCRFGSWGLVHTFSSLVRSFKLKFIRDLEAEVWSVFCCWCLVEVEVEVWTCDMTSSSYFDKMNSALGSVVPLAMFCQYHAPFFRSLYVMSVPLVADQWIANPTDFMPWSEISNTIWFD